MTGAGYFKEAPDVSDVHQAAHTSWNERIRQLHRWLAILFTLTVIVNFAVMIKGPPSPWITYSPLGPLFLLMGTGLYMFALPYLRKLGDQA